MIELVGVNKVHSVDTVISFKDTKFEEGKSYCILGPSGCGKSTLLNLIAGVIHPTEGDVIVNGVKLNSLSQSELDRFRYKNLGYISQDFRLFEDFTVLDNLKIVGTGGVLVNTPEHVLGLVGLKSKINKKVKTLSGGEKQRVSIARALLGNPSIMLCDEPTASLNYKLALDIMNLIVEAHKLAGNTLLVVTHDDRMVKFFDVIVKFDELLKEE